MAVTYADLVAFGFAYVENNVSANSKGHKIQLKTQTSLLLPEDACPCAEEDFILLAEFSEIKGPVALITIPANAELQGSVDMNSFIMRIMSVDYQANPCIEDDDMISWSAFHSALHHLFSLCLRIKASFVSISEMLNVSNHYHPLCFLKEIIFLIRGHFCICQDTQVLQTHISHNRHAYVHYFTLYDLYARGFVRPMCIAYVSADHRKLHRLFPRMREYFLQITEVMKIENRYQFSSEISAALVAIETFCKNQREDEEIHTNPSASRFVGRNCKNEQLLHQYTDFKNMLQTVKASLIDCELAKATLDHWCSAFTSKENVVVTKGVELYVKLVALWKSPSLTSFKINDGGCLLDKHLRPMPALCPWGTAYGMWHLFHAIQMFSHCELSTSLGSFPTLSSLCGSCLSSTSIADSAWEALVHPEFDQLIDAVAGGALEAATISIQEQNDDDDNLILKEGASGNEAEGSSSYHSLSDSTGEACVSSTVKQQIPDNSIHISCNGSTEEASSYKNHYILKGSVCGVSDSPVEDDILAGKDLSHPLVNGDLPNSISVKDSHSKSIKPDNPQENHELFNESNSDDSESFHDILDILHDDDTWSVGSSDDELPLNASWNHCLWAQYRPVSKPGHRLLKFFWTFRSAAQHVIYSLLMGRTLVLAGDAKSERRVSRIINALSPLIPPLDKNGLRVLRWHQGILVSAHIASFQVIGMCIPERLSIHDMISPRDKNSVSILDVNTEQLLGPAYRGQLLAAIGSNIRDFPSDHSVLLFIQSVLCSIGHKLHAYKALVRECNLELPSHACRLLDLHGCDADMIRYLSKIPS